MQYCSNCDTEVEGRFCGNCGMVAVSQGVAVREPVVVQTVAVGASTPARTTLGYVAPAAGVPVQSMGSTADNSFTNDAEFILRKTGERIVWQGKPSILSLVPRAVVWGGVVLLAMMIAAASGRGGGWVVFWLVAGAIHVGAGYLNWHNTTYRITSQRVEYSHGLFSVVTAASPLVQVGNVTILRPFPWGLMQLGHLELDIPDQASGTRSGLRPKVMLKYLKNLETTRDLIHSSSAISNQLWDEHRYAR